jgi:hypothetical protein
MRVAPGTLQHKIYGALVELVGCCRNGFQLENKTGLAEGARTRQTGSKGLRYSTGMYSVYSVYTGRLGQRREKKAKAKRSSTSRGAGVGAQKGVSKTNANRDVK